MSRPDNEDTKAKLEELILKTRADIYQCCKCILWIVCISVVLLACWFGRLQYHTSHRTDNTREDGGYLNFNEFDKNGDGCISEREFEAVHRRFVITQPLERSSQIVLEEMKHLEEEQRKLHTLIADLQTKQKDSELSQWGPWSPWSDCFMNCTGRHGGRLQNRSREIKSLSQVKGHQSETEERPCNAVQFAGCIKEHGAGDNFGVNYDFADQIAASTCAAVSNIANYIFAVRRTCSNLAVSCAETCKNIGLTCFNALLVHRGSPVLQRNVDGSRGLKVYRYNSCDGSYCGPNFCCCRSSKP